MYSQVIKVTTVSPIHRLGYIEAYRTLRERNHFGVLASARFAFWLSHGNPAFPPGEFAAWANEQIRLHPYAIGIGLGLWGYLVTIWILWMITPHSR